MYDNRDDLKFDDIQEGHLFEIRWRKRSNEDGVGFVLRKLDDYQYVTVEHLVSNKVGEMTPFSYDEAMRASYMVVCDHGYISNEDFNLLAESMENE